MKIATRYYTDFHFLSRHDFFHYFYVIWEEKMWELPSLKDHMSLFGNIINSLIDLMSYLIANSCAIEICIFLYEVANQ